MPASTSAALINRSPLINTLTAPPKPAQVVLPPAMPCQQKNARRLFDSLRRAEVPFVAVNMRFTEARQDGRRDCFLGFVAVLLTCLAVTVVAFIGVTRAGAQLTSMVFTSKKRTPPTAGARGHSFALPARDEQ